MNLTKLFETQKILRDRINYNEPDRFNKLILALLVELGECANEQRSWKFWSKDQQPRTYEPTGVCFKCDEGEEENCTCNNGIAFKNPLLEEYVDKLHFILEVGIEIGVETVEIVYFGNEYKCDSITKQFLELTRRIIELWESGSNENKRFYWDRLFIVFATLGEMLGFTWEQVEQAYYEKNKINHQRQSEGY